MTQPPLDKLATIIALVEAVERDQAARKKFHPGDDWAPVEALDRVHTAYLKEHVYAYGWPRLSGYGQRASTAAWLLVQHADLDPVFQKHCLDKMQALLADGEVLPRHVAYLNDRVAVGEGRAQYYGTQFRPGATGEYIASPIEGLGDTQFLLSNRKDLAILNARRHEMGLEPFEVNAARLNEVATKAAKITTAPQR